MDFYGIRVEDSDDILSMVPMTPQHCERIATLTRHQGINHVLQCWIDRTSVHRGKLSGAGAGTG